MKRSETKFGLKICTTHTCGRSTLRPESGFWGAGERHTPGALQSISGGLSPSSSRGACGPEGERREGGESGDIEAEAATTETILSWSKGDEVADTLMVELN